MWIHTHRADCNDFKKHKSNSASNNIYGFGIKDGVGLDI